MRNKVLFVILVMCLPTLVSAGALTLDVTTTIATSDDVTFYFGCGVTIDSCGLGAPGSYGPLPSGVAAYLPPVSNEPIVEDVTSCCIASGYTTFLGLASPSDVVIGLASDIDVTSVTWSSLFPGTSESTIAADLAVGTFANQTAIVSFLEANLTDLVPFSYGSAAFPAGEIGEFSGGDVVGSLSATFPSPEPGTLGLTGLLLGGLAFACRRRVTVDHAK
jgi:hypothetical protein